MFRSAARRLLPALCRRATHHQPYPVRLSTAIMHSAPFSTASPSENAQNEKPKSFDSFTSSAPLNDERNPRTAPRPKARWQEEQARVLQASLGHVVRLGWSDAAMIAGAREVGVSPSIVGTFPRKEAALVEFFMDDCLQRLIDISETTDDLKNLIPSHRVAKLVRIRLEMQAPYISKWPQALSIQAQPLNISTSFKQRATLVDEIWHAAGDESTDSDWYLKRTILGGIYSSTELYMLTDASPDFKDTWAFLDDRVREAFDLKKTVREAKYLFEALGAGMGGPLEGFVKKYF